MRERIEFCRQVEYRRHDNAELVGAAWRLSLPSSNCHLNFFLKKDCIFNNQNYLLPFVTYQKPSSNFFFSFLFSTRSAFCSRLTVVTSLTFRTSTASILLSLSLSVTLSLSLSVCRFKSSCQTHQSLWILPLDGFNPNNWVQLMNSGKDCGKKNRAHLKISITKI